MDTTTDSPPASQAPRVDVVIPVYNEARDLPICIARLRSYLDRALPDRWQITIVDNGSTDQTLAIAETLTATDVKIHLIHLDQKGRGRALRTAWLASNAEIVAYMDVDLSTDLAGFALLISPLERGVADVAIGSRLIRGAEVTRSVTREFTSRTYNYLLRGVFRCHFRDAQCGFKAMTRDVARLLVPRVEDNAWFFDTELLLLAEEAGWRIHELPVCWTEDPGTTVNISATARQDLAGIARVWRQRRNRAAQVARGSTSRNLARRVG